MPKMLSTRTVTMVRARTEAMLTETCTLMRESGAEGLMGEPTHGLVLVASNVSCRVIRVGQRFTANTGAVGAQEALVEMYRLICPVGTAFDTDDVVEMSDGRRFQVVDVEDGLTDEAFAGAVITRVR